VLHRDSRTSAQNYGAFGQYNRLVLEDRGYVLGHVDARVDRIANVDYRLTLSPGAGYYLVKEKDLELSTEAGPAVVFEKFKGSTENSYITLRLAEKLRWNINERSRIFQGLEVQPKVDDFSNYVANFSLKAETDITKSLALSATIQDTYRSDPAPVPGTTPIVLRKRNDIQLLAGVTYKF
jgi:putative salt-induced outer membrane protein YdiY